MKNNAFSEKNAAIQSPNEFSTTDRCSADSQSHSASLRAVDAKVWSAYQLALTLGYMIVVPMVLFGVGGVLLDKHFNSYPLFIFIGFVFALSSSLFVVYTKTKDIVIQGIPKKPSAKSEILNSNKSEKPKLK